jgi:hypothetical protein
MMRVWVGLALNLVPLLFAPGGRADVFDQLQWLSMKDSHFIVYFQEERDTPIARKILREAEKYYQRIGTTIGFTRYGDFWTWDNRARIFLFASKETFLTETGQPEWSTGYVNKDAVAIIGRMIVTYRQEENFFDGLLPHEIGHLILHEFIKDARIPSWFDEGIAQLYEAGKPEQAFRAMKPLVSRGQFIHFRDLMRWDVQQQQDPFNVTLFYAQSVTIVDFLIKRYGSDAFGRLCRNMRDGKSLEEALDKVYPNTVPTLSDLEQKWVSFMTGR